MRNAWWALLLLAGCACGRGAAVEANAAPASASPLDAARVPLYPGATQKELKISPVAKSGNERIFAKYETADGVDKVVQFYKDKLGLMSAAPPGVKMVQMVGKTPNGGFVQLLIEPNDPKTEIQYYAMTPAKR